MFYRYKTLLILHDKIRIFRDLPAHASKDLRRVIDAISPFKSLRQIQDETGIQSSEFLRLCAHLVMWTRLITTINANSQYAVSPSTNLSTEGPLFKAFESRYGGVGDNGSDVSSNSFQILARLLGDIGTGARFGTVLQRQLVRACREKNEEKDKSTLSTTKEEKNISKQTTTTTKTNRITKTRMDMIQWLLRMNAIVEVHEYIYTLYDHNPDEDESVRLEEEAYTRSPQRVRETLRKILPFCDGKHTVEEIIFQSNVLRRNIQKVVQTYPKILVICTRSEEEIEYE